MNKRNFIIDFALKSKYNFFACIVALLVLVFSIGSITYSWVEGATSLKIQTGTTAKVYANADRAVNVIAQPSGIEPTLNLADYIDPADCCLAPATAVKNDDNSISVKFLRYGSDSTQVSSYRDADTNDISNNYIFFETKIKPNDDISNYRFDSGAISIDSINVAVSVLDANRNILSSNIFTSAQVKSNATACQGLTKGTEYILQFRIWNDVNSTEYNTDDFGKEATINFTLVPQANFTTLFLRDYTNSESAKKLLDGKTVKAIAGGKESTGVITAGSEYNQYKFDKVPADTDSLMSVQFVAYNSNGTVFAKWDLTGTPVGENSIYNAYGGASSEATFGTFDDLKQVFLVDKSYENLLKANTAVTLKSGADSYTMYRGASKTNFSAYVPKSATNFEFSNAKYYANESSLSTDVEASATPTYYILGESQTKTSNKTKCVGFWDKSSTLTSFTTISIKDRSTGRLVDGKIVYASYPDSKYETVKDVLYKAYYDTTNRQWQLTATNSSFTNNEIGMVWNFKAYDSSSAQLYSWYVDGRKKIDSTTYTFKNAVAGDNASDGTWGIYEVSQINPYILYEDSNKLVSFYGGITSDWTVNNMYLSDSSAKDSHIAEYDKSKPSSGFPKTTIDSTDYYVAEFIDVVPASYYLKNNFDWSGLQFESATTSVQGGKFYGIYSTGYQQDYPLVKSAITGATKLNGSNSTSESNKISILQGPVSFQTVTSSATSLLGEDLYIEYHICPTEDENSANYYCINPSILDSENNKGANCTKVDSSKTTTRTFDLTEQSIDEFIDENGTEYTIKTVLTDGTVYYVADKDYITITGVAQMVSVTLESADNVVSTVGYSGGTITEGETVEGIYQGTELTLNAAPATDYEFSKFEIRNTSGTLLQTITTNNSKYSVPDCDIVIKTIVTEQTSRTFYLQNDAGWTGTPKAHIWFGDTPYASWNDDNKAYMTHVTENIWKYDLPNDGNTYTNLLFHDGDIKAPSNKDGTDIRVGYIYNNKTNTWSEYSGGTTTNYTVTFSNPTGGTISVTRNGNTGVSSGTSVPGGTQLTITVTPNSDYTVKSITANGTALTVTGNTATYTVSSNTTIAATLEQAASTTNVYLKNTSNWETPKVHIWNNDVGDYKTWNSDDEKMTYDSTSGLWYYTVPNNVSANYDRILFHNNGENKSSDLVLYYGYEYNNTSLFTWAPKDSTTSETKVITLNISGEVSSADGSGTPVYYLYTKEGDKLYYFADSKTYSSSNTYKFIVPKSCTSFTVERKDPKDLGGNAWNTWSRTVTGTSDQTITVDAWP